MVKKLKALGLIALLLGLFTIPVWGGAFEDTIQSTYVYVNLKNYVTTALPTVGTRGRVTYDSTVDQVAVDNGTYWYRLLSSGRHQDLSQPTIPTLVTGSGTVDTGSNDHAGRVTMSGSWTGVVIAFSTAYANIPFCMASHATNMSTAPGLASAPNVTAETLTGFTVTGLPANAVFKYHCSGYYS